MLKPSLEVVININFKKNSVETLQKQTTELIDTKRLGNLAERL